MGKVSGLGVGLTGYICSDFFPDVRGRSKKIDILSNSIFFWISPKTVSLISVWRVFLHH